MAVAAFGDFGLSRDGKFPQRETAGCLTASASRRPGTSRTGPEYQVLDNAKAKDGKLPNHPAASLYDLVAPAQEPTKPIGEWNTARIVVQDHGDLVSY